jgi:cystathionine beta-lyase/cystathionine gamma-synthase
LQRQSAVKRVFYPGLHGTNDQQQQHALATRQFAAGLFGSMVAFELAGGRAAADQFIARAHKIPFCPSLGEAATTISHPETTSHRGMTAAERSAIGITDGTLRLSVGIESAEFVCAALGEGLQTQ